MLFESLFHLLLYVVALQIVPFWCCFDKVLLDEEEVLNGS